MPLVPDVLNLFEGETENYSVDFSGRLAGDTIHSLTSVLSDCGDLNITNQTFDDNNVYFTLSGPLPCKRCNIGVTVVTLTNRVLVGEVQIRVAEQ